MPKIESITAETSINDFIDLEDVKSKSSKISEKEIDTFSKESKEKIINQISNGGLNEYSLNIGGYAPAYYKANLIIKKFDEIMNKVEEAEKQINKDGKQHRKKEHDTYEDKIDKKLTSLREQLRQVQRKIDNDINAVNSFFGGLYSERANINKEIKKYEAKNNESISKRPY